MDLFFGPWPLVFVHGLLADFGVAHEGVVLLSYRLFSFTTWQLLWFVTDDIRQLLFCCRQFKCNKPGYQIPILKKITNKHIWITYCFWFLFVWSRASFVLVHGLYVFIIFPLHFSYLQTTAPLFVHFRPSNPPPSETSKNAHVQYVRAPPLFVHHYISRDDAAVVFPTNEVFGGDDCAYVFLRCVGVGPAVALSGHHTASWATN